ncbi:50S ribosomal protein L11 methyltransferase [Desulfobacterota bacterium AH_259_B03_O07]|nr:50S ribosomal protein L11 methyltransferase [Desulfobacterota bacterium AH_259_B03_O07]
MKLSIVGSEDGKSLISDFLLGLNAFSVAEDVLEGEKFEISGYFSKEVDMGKVIERLKLYVPILENIIDGLSVEKIDVEEINRSSWEVWKNRLKTIRASEKVVIRPPWEQYLPRNDEIVIEINPSMAFGTGHHETTRLCIRGIEHLLKTISPKRVIDVGCGSGILSIVASLLGAKEIVALDIDQVAVKEAKNNFERNLLKKNIKLVCGYIDSVKGKFDLIVANISVETIILMRNELKNRLSPDGLLLISGIPCSRRDELISGMGGALFVKKDEIREGDWIGVFFHVDKNLH